MVATPDLPELMRHRYGSDMVNAEAQDDCLNRLLSHRSVRAYLPDPLPAGTLELLVAAAQSASSSANLQTWSVVAVEDQARKATLSQLAGNQAHIRQCPLFLVWLADLARLAHIADRRGLPHEGLDYLEMFLTATIDAALAAQNAAIAAESLGLGIVYIGGMRNQPQAVAETLKLPPQSFGVFGMCVGYPDPAQPAAIKPRLPQSAVLHRETYDLATQDEAIAQYNQVMQAFYAEQQMNVPGDWADHSVKRIANASALNGRDRLRDVLRSMGFELQ
jgi:nitroreductase